MWPQYDEANIPKSPWPLLPWDSAVTLSSSFLALLWLHPPKVPGSWGGGFLS